MFLPRLWLYEYVYVNGFAKKSGVKRNFMVTSVIVDDRIMWTKGPGIMGLRRIFFLRFRLLIIIGMIGIFICFFPAIQRYKQTYTTTTPKKQSWLSKNEGEKTTNSLHLKPSCMYSDLSSLETTENSPNSRIPQIMHFIYKSTEVPDQYIALVKKCQRLNQDHSFIFWTDQSALDFIKSKYPDHHYLFEKHFKDGLEFSDALRYFIIHYFGGVYLDLDVECLKPFTDAMKDYRCVLDRERELQTQIYWNTAYSAMNSVMGCQGKHPFFERAIEQLKESAIKQKGILARTGPEFLTNQFKIYNKSSLGMSRPITLAASAVFSPLMDENHLPIFRQICKSNKPKQGFRKAACEEFKNNGYSNRNVTELTKNSITIHRFFHLGWGSWKFKITKLSSICTTAPLHIFKL